jgi:cardiolipin synthase A/B
MEVYHPAHMERFAWQLEWWFGASGTWLALLVGLVLVGGGGCASYQGKTVQTARGQLYAASDPRFINQLGPLLGTTTVAGNGAQELINGDQFFPAMLGAIQDARESITLETYLFWGGQIGGEFSRTLADRAREGVQVRVLLDWIGSRRVDRGDVALMRAAGAEVRFFNPLSVGNPGRLNHRTHRKLLVVDGRTGFIGGAGFADFWLGDAQTDRHWRDAYYRVEGPVVGQMQSAFMENWHKVTGEIEVGDAFFPELSPVGTAPAHVFSNTVGAGTDRVRLMYLLAIDAARRSIRISMAYFIPCTRTQQALIAARGRGVDVQIIVPNDHIDSKIVRPSSRRSYGPLLRAGVRIFEYEPAMYHTKAIVIDETWVSVGSANFDNRSFRYSDEANLNILSSEFARAQLEVFDADRARAHEVTYETWKRRSVAQRFFEILSLPIVPLI